MTFAADVETKTSYSTAVSVMRNDTMKARQVCGLTESAWLLPSEEAAHERVKGPSVIEPTFRLVRFMAH
ncbi:hypothetical protein [Arthrobacter sp. S2(2024)]|uniref:hypothetical protein n=1 Tax=Arthrobacter sp. S2(2024) TaxID=3111911 RepID=UPI002FC73B69